MVVETTWFYVLFSNPTVFDGQPFPIPLYRHRQGYPSIDWFGQNGSAGDSNSVMIESGQYLTARLEEAQASMRTESPSGDAKQRVKR